jgi:hypothetical protein
VDINSDVNNCGQCNYNCLNLPNVVSASCMSATCVLSGCATNKTSNGETYTQFADCDNNPANGCETSLSSYGNCGGCGHTCANCPSSTLFYCTSRCNIGHGDGGVCNYCYVVGTSRGPSFDCGQ